MTIKGDMAGYASSQTGIDYDKCRDVIRAALAICTDWDFSQRFLAEGDHSVDPGHEYIEAVKFLQKMV